MTADTPRIHAETTKLSLSGIALNVQTVLGILSKAEPIVLALPAFADLLSAAISVFSHEDKQAVLAAYQERMPQTDAAHEETQKLLTETADTTDISGTDASPKGGGQ